MSEIGGREGAPQSPEHREHEPAPAKRHGYARVVDSLLSSIPGLLGVLVGALTSYFAQTQQVSYAREDAFRRDQIKRVALVSHNFDNLNDALIPMVATLQERLPDICRRMASAGQLEQLMIRGGYLHTPFFSAKGSVNDGPYEAELTALTKGTTPAAGPARALQSLYTDYTAMLGNIGAAQKQFGDRWEDFQATLVFEVRVYFPDQLRRDVSDTVNAYYAVEKDALRAIRPATACSVKPDSLAERLTDLHFRSSQEMIQFAQRLEPELNNKAIQR